MSRKNNIIYVVVGIAVFAVVALFLMKSHPKEKQSSLPQSFKSQPVASETREGWKKYSNQQEQYEIHYPSNWFEVISPTETKTFSNENISSPLEMSTENGIHLSITPYKTMPEWKQKIFEGVMKADLGETIETSSYTYTKESDFNLGQSKGFSFSAETTTGAAIESGFTYNYVVVANGIPLYQFEFLSSSQSNFEKNRSTMDEIVKSFFVLN